jgi:uncharacterized protein
VIGGDAGSLAVQFTVLLLELLTLLLVVSAGLALAVRRMGLGRLQRWLGGSRVAGTLKGLALGFAIPFCTYSAIPTVVAMIDARVRTATLASFLLAAPLLDPLVVAVLVLLFGWQAALAYAGATAGAVVVLALTADVLRAERLVRPARRPSLTGVGTPGHPATQEACAPDPFTDEHPWRGLLPESREASGYALRLVRGLALPMVVAVAVAAAIVGLVPEQLLARFAGPDNPLAVPTAAVLGAPFYVSTEAFLPVASALHANGMGIGAVFALVVSAAGVNVPELALLSRLMRPRLLVAYTAAILGAAVAAGYLVPMLLRLPAVP